MKKLSFFAVFLFFLFAGLVVFAGNIDSVYRWAWGDTAGWLDFGYPPGNVAVGTSTLTGYASTSMGIFSLNCADFSLCGTSNYYVARAPTTSGAILSGWAWNDTIGWTSFNCSDLSICGTSNYSVTLDAYGYFHGWAWNDKVGWLSVNCTEPGVCGTSSYKVKGTGLFYAAYGDLVSTTYDTGITQGVSYNSFMWEGVYPVGTAVKFQLATATSSSGPWSFVGPDGTANTWYQPTGPDQPTAISNNYHFGMRYFQYKVRLVSSYDQTQTPVVNKVIVNYSP